MYRLEITFNNVVSYFTGLSVLFSQVARRCWSGNLHAKRAICKAMEQNPLLKVTTPSHVEDLTLLDNALKP